MKGLEWWVLQAQYLLRAQLGLQPGQREQAFARSLARRVVLATPQEWMSGPTEGASHPQ